MEPRFEQPLEADKSWIRLPRQWSAFPPRLFFEPGPALLIPVFDRPFIALARSCHWLLSTPATLSQEPPHMITMIPHSRSVRSITTATRLAVHTSARKPYASAPLANNAGI